MLDRPELNTFLVQPPNKDRTQIIIFLGPATYGGINKERVFILAEVSSSNLDFKKQIQIFINQLAKKHQELERENPLLSFENSLEWANRELRENFEPKELGQVSMVFGSLRNEHLQFAVGGNISAHIFYRENEEYKNSDLIKNYAPDNHQTEIFFPNLISGTIHQNNFTVFSTPTVLNYLTLDRLQKIITNNKTEEICPRIENLLGEIENKVAFGGIVLAWPEEKSAAPLSSSFKLTPNESINRLLKKQKETAQMMSPAVLQSIKKYLQNKKNKNTPSSSQEDLKTLKKITKIYTRLTGWQGRISLLWQKILIVIGKTIYKFFLFTGGLFKKITTIDFHSLAGISTGLKNLSSSFKTSWNGTMAILKTKYSSLSLRKKILFPLTAVVCLILLASLSFVYFQQKKTTASTNFEQLVMQIRSKIDEAESSLIYKNEDQAEQLIKETKNLLAGFPTDSAKRLATKEELNDLLQPLIYKLQKIQEVAATVEIDLNSLHLEKEPSALVKIGHYFFLFTKDTSSIQSYNQNTKQLIKNTDEKIAVWQNISTQKDNTILVLSKQNILTQFDPEKNSFSSQETGWPDKNNKITLAATYNAKLYSLDAQNNQIYKHLPSTTGFGKGSVWLKSNSGLNFSDAISFVIDGNIYVGKANGQIYKFESGQQKDFNINFVDPVLTSLTKIYTKNGSDLFFVLDKEKRRVVIWNKNTNKLISQLTSPDWNNLKDFSIDEKERKIYLLNDNQIMSVKF